MAKEPTKIRCPNDCGDLMREWWGQDKRRLPEWHITCNVCAFSDIVSDDMLNKYLYFGKVIHGE